MRHPFIPLFLGAALTMPAAVRAELVGISASRDEVEDARLQKRQTPPFLMNKGCTFYRNAHGRGASIKVTTTKQDNNLQRSVIRKDAAQWWKGRIGSVRCDFVTPVRCHAFHRISHGWDILSTRLNADGALAAIPVGYNWNDQATSLTVICSLAR